jgi:hypothetical protein
VKRTWTWLASSSTWRTTSIWYSYDPTDGLLTQTDDQNDLGVPRDDLCVRYSYSSNTALYRVDHRSRVQTVSVSCATAASYPGDAVADERYYYDGASTWGTVPTRGDVTRTEEGCWATTGYDTWGGSPRQPTRWAGTPPLRTPKMPTGCTLPPQ